MKTFGSESLNERLNETSLFGFQALESVLQIENFYELKLKSLRFHKPELFDIIMKTKVINFRKFELFKDFIYLS